jgi:TolA-binding protein
MAAKYYREFVESFPQDKKAAKMNFLLAESLNDSADYNAAAIAYESTAYNYTHYKKSAIAGYTAILVRQKYSKKLKGEGKIAGVNDTVVSSIRFADNFPNHKQVPAVLLKAAEELVTLKRYSEASALAHRITQLNHKRSKKFKKAAWAIIAKVELDLGRLKTAEMASLKRLKYSNPNDKDHKALLQRLAATIYKQGEKARKEGRLFEAAKHFLRVGKLAPTSTISTTAEYDAAAVFVKIKDWDRAIPILNKFIRRNPKHKLTPGAIDKLAVSYEQSNQWRYAAATYEEIARRTKKSKAKSDLLWKTAELYEKADLKKNAIDVYKKIVEIFQKPVEPAIEARVKLADIYKDLNQIEKRHFWLRMIMQADGRDGSTERTRFVAAKAAMELAEPTFNSFKRVKLVQPLKKSLKKKKLLLEKCLAAYTTAASYGIEEITTASTFRIGEIYNEFSHVLYTSERPKGLNETELEQYDLLLEEQAFPFEEKAIEIHTTNTKRANNGTYDSWVKKSFDVLRKMLPARYAKNEKSELFNSLIN